jgi:hypothetical protein
MNVEVHRSRHKERRDKEVEKKRVKYERKEE